MAGCRIRIRVEAGCGIKEILKPGCGMKMQGQHWDKPHFEGAMQDRTARCEVISESQNLNIHKATRLLLLKCKFWSLCWRISDLQQCKAMYVPRGSLLGILRCVGATCTLADGMGMKVLVGAGWRHGIKNCGMCDSRSL